MTSYRTVKKKYIYIYIYIYIYMYSFLAVLYSNSKGKVHPVQALGICRGRTAHGPMPTALEGGERWASRPGRSLPPGKTRYLLYRRLGGSQSRSGQVWKISPPPGFDPRTVQSVASRYTDYATRPTDFTVRVLYGTACIFSIFIITDSSIKFTLK